MFHLVFFLSLFFNLGCLGKTAINNDSDLLWDNCAYGDGDHPCNFTFEDQKGNEVSLYDFYGQPIVLDFSTGWCGFCGIAAKEVQQVQDMYASHDLIYITVMTEDHRGWKPDAEFCQDWADAFGIYSAPVLAGNKDMLSDNSEDGWVIEGYPAFAFIDPEMVIQGQYTGFSPGHLHDYISKIISE